MFLSFFVSTVFDFIHRWTNCTTPIVGVPVNEVKYIISKTNVWFSIHNLINYHLIVACLSENNTHSFFSNQNFNGCVVQDICMFHFHVIFCGATGLTGFTHLLTFRLHDFWCVTFISNKSIGSGFMTSDATLSTPFLLPPSLLSLLCNKSMTHTVGKTVVV